MSVSSETHGWRRHASVFLWALIALMPVLYIAGQFAAGSRNFPFWDEIDSALDFLVRLHASHDWRTWFTQLFALSNEHRTVTSRLIFAISYWLTGTVNFHVIGAIGNLFILAACGLLIYAAGSLERRVRVAVVLGLLVFQLEQFENFIWSGASIDHFQVVMLAVAAFVCLTHPSRTAFAGATVCGILATFTLAHGALVWPLGAVWLWQRRAWHRLEAWAVIAAITCALFFQGFTFNPGHNIPHLTGSALVSVAVFWIQLVGAPLALGHRAIAAVPGVLLLVLLGILLRRGALQRSPALFLTVVFGLASLALVAFGRVNLANQEITSRYLILGSLAWAITLCLLLDEAATTEHPYRWLGWVAPALIGFNISANITFQKPKETFIEVRDRAATHYKQYGRTGDGISRMHPQPRHADQVLAAAYAAGVYHLARVSELTEFPSLQPNDDLIVQIDELVANERAITVGGWAMIRGKTSKRGQVYVILQSENAVYTYSTLTLQRPDVAAAYHEPRWRLCGFRAVIGSTRLPLRNYRIGVLIKDAGKAEYRFTDKQLALAPGTGAPPQLATALAGGAGSGRAD